MLSPPSQTPGLILEQEPLLPKHKFDTAAFPPLQALPSSAIEPLIPELLKWYQDPNWPIFPSVHELLLKHREIVTPRVKELLRAENDDVAWKYWLVTQFVSALEVGEKESLRGELERIAERPTKLESENELAEGALEVLESREKKGGSGELLGEK